MVLTRSQAWLHRAWLKVGENGVLQIRRDGTGMGRYGPRYRTAAGCHEGGGNFYPQMTQMFTDEGEDREGAGNRGMAWSPSVEILQPICG